jgi:hypothetical protein
MKQAAAVSLGEGQRRGKGSDPGDGQKDEELDLVVQGRIEKEGREADGSGGQDQDRPGTASQG